MEAVLSSPLAVTFAFFFTSPLAVTFALFFTSSLYGYLCDNGYLYERKVEMVRLTCRTLSPKVDNVNMSGNRFAKEYGELFLYVTDILDFAACKYIDRAALPLLVQQEHNHALMHKVNKTKYVRRLEPVRIVLDFLLLRAGRTIGLGLTCAIEVGTSAFTHALLNQNLIPNVASNAVLFHLMEETEHTCLTVSHLRPQIAWYVRILLTPLILVLITVYSFGGIFTHLLSHPLEILDWKMYHELALYLLVFGPTFLSYCWEVLLHFIPPGNEQGETKETRDERIALVDRCIKQANVNFTCNETDIYPVVM